MCNLKNATWHWKYSYDYNQTFTNEANFGMKQLISIWYDVKEPNQTKSLPFNYNDRGEYECRSYTIIIKL